MGYEPRPYQSQYLSSTSGFMLATSIPKRIIS
jgi:hypothetical protein